MNVMVARRVNTPRFTTKSKVKPHQPKYTEWACASVSIDTPISDLDSIHLHLHNERDTVLRWALALVTHLPTPVW